MKLWSGSVLLTEINQASIVIMPWIDDYINVKQSDLTIHSSHNIVGDLVKSSLRLGHGRAVIFYIKLSI